MRRQPPASPSPPGKRLGPLQRLDFRIPAADRLGLGLDLANKLTSVSAEAKAAGLRLGDRVVLLDGVDVSGGRDRVTQFAARRARDATSVLVGVERRGKPSRDWATVPPALLLCLFFSSVGALLFTVSMLERLHIAVGDEGGELFRLERGRVEAGGGEGGEDRGRGGRLTSGLSSGGKSGGEGEVARSAAGRELVDFLATQAAAEHRREDVGGPFESGR